MNKSKTSVEVSIANLNLLQSFVANKTNISSKTMQMYDMDYKSMILIVESLTGKSNLSKLSVTEFQKVAKDAYDNLRKTSKFATRLMNLPLEKLLGNKKLSATKPPMVIQDVTPKPYENSYYDYLAASINLPIVV